MKETFLKSNSEGSLQLDEDALKAMIDESAEVLLTIFKQFGQDSKQHQIAEHYFECIKTGYAFCTAKREFNDLCEEHHMIFNAEAVQTILDINKTRAAIQEQLDKLGLN